MRLAIVGVGQAGGKVLDRLFEYDTAREGGFIQHAVAINSAKQDLQGLEHVPESNRLLVGESIVNGQGTGTDPEIGRACIQEDLEEIRSAIDRAATSEIDAFLVIAGLGGGTGSGGAPVIAERIREIYPKPVYGLGILPAADEGGIYNLNAAKSLQRFVEHTDNVLLFDNGSFKHGGESLAGGYAEINDETTSRFGMFFSAGEIDAMAGNVAESVVDSSEIINTLGQQGLTSVGYATEEIETRDGGGLLGRLLGRKDDEPEFASEGSATNRITSLVRRATLGELTLPCEIESASRALLIVAGPPEHLDRKGLDKARQWIEERTGSLEVRAGDYPRPDSDRIAVLVVLSGVTDVPRIEEIQRLAADAERESEARAENSDEELEELIEYDDTE